MISISDLAAGSLSKITWISALSKSYIIGILSKNLSANISGF